MSAIPPPLVGSVLQSSLTQQQSAAIQKTESNLRDQAFRDEVQAVEQRGGTVFSADEDTRINPDGGGGGSQGRAFQGGAEEPADTCEGGAPNTGITVDDTGQVHLDLEA